jgi:hypothetical protein
VAANKRKNLLARIVTPGGDDPLLLRLVAPEVIRTGAAATGIALVGQGGAGGYAYSILTGSAYGGLPPGLTLNANGTITGTPTTTGTFSFVAQVQDSASSIYTATFSLRMLSRMFRKHKAIRNGEVGIPYVFQFKVGGNTGSVTWSLASGNFPAGLTLNTSTGVLSGTPTADSNGLGGTSYFTVRATDGGSGETLDMPDKIRIYDELVMPSAPRIVIVYIGRYFEHQIEPTGGTGIYQFSIPSGQTMPVGIKFDSRTGLFYGVPAGPPTLSPWDTDVRVGDVFASDLYEYLFVVMRQVNSDAPIDGKKYLRRDGDWEEFTGGGGGSVASVGGALPDSSGDIAVTSPDGSVGISVDSSGALALTAAGGGVGSVGGATPDSSGNVGIGSSDASIVAAVDSNGDLDLTVNPATRAPMAGFGNGSLTLTGTMTLEIPYMKYGGTITGWRIVGNTAGDASITVSHSTFAAYNTMTTLFTAVCSGAIKASDTGLSHPFAIGDVLRFSATGFSGFTRCAIVLDVA